MKVATGTMDRNLALLQQNQTEASKDADENILNARQRQSDAKMKQLSKNEEAGNLKGDAADAGTRYQAVAAGLAAAGAAAMLIPVVGAVIGAILLAVAAVFAVLAHLEQKGQQQEAAKKEQEAGMPEMQAESQSNRVETMKKNDEDRRNFVNEISDKQLDLQKQAGDAATKF